MDALPQLAILAVVAGLFTGFVILVFRASIDFVLGYWILPSGSESFEELALIKRLLLPVIGGALIGALMTQLPPADQRVGVVHVMERLSRHQGYLPARNALIQFTGGIVALISGQSGGREGPSIHLGAASSSLLGQAFQLPNNSIRTLVACGTASAIAASFNTPIAGVIFAMEVVMMEYTIGSFIPVIIASVTSTLLTHYFFGNEPAFMVAPLHMRSLLEIPYIIGGGVLIGGIAAGFIMLVQQFARLAYLPFYLRALLAGSIVAVAGIATPEVMGIGYDTVNGAMLGKLGLTTLCMIVLMKSIASASAVGLGMPVGIIGPTFVIGASIGGILGIVGNWLEPNEATSIGFYVMLGMSAMMAAVLQAPLAALMAVLELTANPNVILPAMLIIVVATMISGTLFKQKSVFLSTLNTLGLRYPPSPVTLHLQRAGVTAIMNRKIEQLNYLSTEEEAREAIHDAPAWIAVQNTAGEIRCVLNASDLRIFLETNPDVATLNLLEIPGQRLDVATINSRATVSEAQEALNSSNAEALCVRRITAPLIDAVLGIITQEDIDNYREVSE